MHIGERKKEQRCCRDQGQGDRRSRKMRPDRKAGKCQDMAEDAVSLFPAEGREPWWWSNVGAAAD